MARMSFSPVSRDLGFERSVHEIGFWTMGRLVSVPLAGIWGLSARLLNIQMSRHSERFSPVSRDLGFERVTVKQVIHAKRVSVPLAGIWGLSVVEQLHQPSPRSFSPVSRDLGFERKALAE